MHFKYSSMMNITFITMMFGPGIPILFPIAAASFFVLYLIENYMLYYVYKEPPAYDEKLNNSVLRSLSFAPLFLLGFGYWMLSNQQLLKNDIVMRPLETATGAFYAEHYWYQSFIKFTASGPASFLLVFFMIYFVYIFFSGPFNMITDMCFKTMKLEDLEINEDIDKYANCLDKDCKNWTMKEEENLRRFGIKTMFEKNL